MLPAGEQDIPQADELARRLKLPLLPIHAVAACTAADAVLLVQGARLSLQRTGAGVAGPVSVDFGSKRMRHRRRSGANELLGRAVGVGKKAALQVLDATAGLGRDAFVLADLGCDVTLCERHPVLAELLAWGLREAAASDDPWLAANCARMNLRALDARRLDPRVLAATDVIYLDPMYAQRSRRAAPSREMALFSSLLGESVAGEDDDLIHWAQAQSPARVVVKRAPRAESLGQLTPSHCIAGKAVRYDVYVLRALG